MAFGDLVNIFFFYLFEYFGRQRYLPPIGLAYSRLSGWQGSGVFDHLVGDFNWYDGFSLCMGPKGGVLSLGVDYSKDSRFKWTDISDEIWYSVVVNDIKFGGKSIGMDYYYLNYGYGGPIVDSGTTLFIVTTTIMAAIRTTIEGFCKTVITPSHTLTHSSLSLTHSHSAQTPLVGVCNVKQNQSLFDGQCFTMTPAQVNAFPLLTVTLPGVGDLAVPPSNYLWQGTGVPGQVPFLILFYFILLLLGSKVLFKIVLHGYSRTRHPRRGNHHW